uniref:Uncharacterized protein n=1 Tax=Fagus sylvatica TaxID=28930 RepID=A0A2N9ILJ8_FAGSY
MGFSPPFMGYFPPIVASSPPYVEFVGSLGVLRLFEDRGSESLMISPPCLRSDLFKHLIIVCPCAQITCALIPWFKRFEHPTIRSVEDCFFDLPACHLLI